ncbi:hypothetical protein [Deinococcus navajonensis]|uniref:Uncharacterized protein n=1 Tax=Deinococcus navajonensis TaxID=309884 RepID=A0ABV8XJT7_9DEIO
MLPGVMGWWQRARRLDTPATPTACRVVLGFVPVQAGPQRRVDTAALWPA